MGVALTAQLTKLDVNDPLLFFGAALALIVSLVGFGLLLGLLIPTPTRSTPTARCCSIGLAAAVYFVDSARS